MLDGKEISATAKKFLLNWKANREARKRQMLEKERREKELEKTSKSEPDMSTIYFQAVPPLLPQLTTGFSGSYPRRISTGTTFTSNISGSRIPQDTR
jgi:CRISPR/Cas system-associated endonuclease Cas1